MKTIDLSILSRIFRFFNRKVAFVVALIVLYLPLGIYQIVDWLLKPESRLGKSIMLIVGGGLYLIIQCVWAFIVAIQWNIAFPKFGRPLATFPPAKK